MIILTILILFIVYLTVDFYFGKRQLHRSIIKRSYPKRMMDWELFGNGHDLYDRLFQDIQSATQHIHIQFFIIKKDRISEQFLQLLMKKAAEGVTVRLLLDRIGGFRVSKNKIKQLREAGILFEHANKPRLPFLFFSIQHRNHRKVTIIDGEIGYFGGFNIGEEYLGNNPRLGFWRDFHLRITGESVRILQSEFLFDWQRETRTEVNSNELYPTALQNGTTGSTFMPSDGVGIESFLLQFINSAEKEIVIASPYYIPGKKINESLIEAANRGIQITLLVPLKADHPLVRAAAFPYFKLLLNCGVKIYRYDYGFYHGKCIIIDQRICDFGTANFDKRSFFINNELNCLIEDRIFINDILTEIHHDIIHAKPLTIEEYKARPLQQRPIEVLSSLLSGLL
ncbi:cardiolipin synthase [Bacillus solimangrovi]|uniref:Cardiolipin synthase n=1 Tax=Bacillus solimangrovi TaxID=1305675 RepID=A0A1E5LGN3_9BACI|nr:cardiolipin synthase [Bacillus solimangrovi]OEH93235.1 cardiolipin synthase [Bacillus solimangrovi]